jgi:hypothetical protein
MNGRRLGGAAAVVGGAFALAFAGAGCSSSAAGSDGGAGSGGAGGVAGTAGQAGGAGTGGGAGNAGNAGNGGSNAACAIPQRTTEPTTCDDFDVTSAWITSTAAMVSGNGIMVVATGQVVVPQGGTLVDGDYELVAAAWGQQPGINVSRRIIRLFAGGTEFDWSADNENPAADGGVAHFRIDSIATVNGTNLQMQIPSTCGGTLNPVFGYTVSGSQLLLFNFNADALFTYQRTCAR